MKSFAAAAIVIVVAAMLIGAMAIFASPQTSSETPIYYPKVGDYVEWYTYYMPSTVLPGDEWMQQTMRWTVSEVNSSGYAVEVAARCMDRMTPEALRSAYENRSVPLVPGGSMGFTWAEASWLRVPMKEATVHLEADGATEEMTYLPMNHTLITSEMGDLDCFIINVTTNHDGAGPQAVSPIIAHDGIMVVRGDGTLYWFFLKDTNIPMITEHIA